MDFLGFQVAFVDSNAEVGGHAVRERISVTARSLSLVDVADSLPSFPLVDVHDLEAAVRCPGHQWPPFVATPPPPPPPTTTATAQQQQYQPQ